MARISFDGFKGGDAFGVKLEELSRRETRGMIRRAVGRGAVIVADALEAALRAIPSQKSKYLKANERLGSPLQRFEKKDLLDSLGITPVNTDSRGFTNAKVGFDGYGSRPTKEYPSGVPNPLLAASVERGSSVRPAHPFVKPTVAKVRKRVIQAMDESINEDIAAIFDA